MKKKQESKQPTTKINIDTRQKTITEITRLIDEKVRYIQEIIRNTILSVNHYKKCDIFSNSDVVICVNTLVDLYDKTVILLKKIVHIPENILGNSSIIENGLIPVENTTTTPIVYRSSVLTVCRSSGTGTTYTFEEMNVLIDELQKIIDKLSIVICGFGTKQMSDLLYISLGQIFATS
jgi:hypothetical protein